MGKVRIKLEPGIQSGKILRLRGKGITSLNGYGTGDLLVHVNVWTPKVLNKEQKEFFERMQSNENFIKGGFCFIPNIDFNLKNIFSIKFTKVNTSFKPFQYL